MTEKRKRRQTPSDESQEPKKRAKFGNAANERSPEDHPTLSLYYSSLLTLRAYILSKLPKSSKSRRRRIKSARDDLLDTNLVCEAGHQRPLSDSSRFKDFEIFSQQANVTLGSSIGEGLSPVSDVVDFAIWLLFHRIHRQTHRPPHLLCHGYQRATNSKQANDEQCAVAGIPGLTSHYPNNNVSILKSAGWMQIHGLLGKEGDRIMLDLILDCGIFIKVDSGQSNFYQLSGDFESLASFSESLAKVKPGIPLTDLPTLIPSSGLRDDMKTPKPLAFALNNSTDRGGVSTTCLNSPGTISFVRNRTFYARAVLNAKGKVTFGFRHIHVLNRFADPHDKRHTVHIMKYIFPRQFRLHNVFISKVDPRETVQPFKDYTLREHEISRCEQTALQKGSSRKDFSQWVPKRLRGDLLCLIQKLQIRQSRCSYYELLKHYCPINRVEVSRAKGPPIKVGFTQHGNHTSELLSSSEKPLDEPNVSTRPPQSSLTSLANPASHVSAFCRASLLNIIPHPFFGEGDEGTQNRNLIMKNVDRFIRLRRFETLTLHVVLQRIKLGRIAWLRPTGVESGATMSASDMRKRKEIFLEFLYYVFDSLLIPLIRSNFHVTESNVHQNRLFYFRHDVWRAMTEPAISKLKLSMFEEINNLRARKLLDARTLGFSQIRLLPKGNGVRPITNLRRRITKLQHGRVTLGRSINSVMAPVFNVLDFERKRQPELLGSALFSVSDMYPKLKAYAHRLRLGGASSQRLFFAKVDAKSCFDTIPQRKVVRLMEHIASDDTYRIARHAEIKVSNTHSGGKPAQVKPARKFVATARSPTEFPNFDETLEKEIAKDKKNAVFVDNIVQTVQKKRRVHELLRDHVESNIIKIGKKFYRQKAGIPQGSVLSSLLCNYFYAQLERECFGFLDGRQSVLLRLIDDFLLITTNKEHARRFLQIMHDGVSQYGIEVNPVKSLVNFEASINRFKVPRLAEGAAVPYCGNNIDTQSLEITKDRDRRKATVIADTLTVELSKTPGTSFYRKALNSFKIQTHRMFLDTDFNRPDTVLSTIYQNFAEVAMKYYRYAKSMQAHSRPHVQLLIGTIKDLADLAYILVKEKHKVHRAHDYKCTVSKCQVQWLATRAFRTILAKKQSRYRDVIAWLDGAIAEVKLATRQEVFRLDEIVDKGNAMFSGYRF